MPLENFSFVPVTGRFGGVCLLWDRNTTVDVKLKCKSIIHATVTQIDGKQWELVCVYGDLGHTRNPVIWKRILEIIERSGPVCVIGDFNAIVDEDEKVGGDPVLDKNSRDFKIFLFDGGLVDLGFKGPAFTWTNKRNTSAAIYERLDLVVSNVNLLQTFTEAYVTHLPRLHSDHAAIMLRLRGHKPRQRSFKMETWWFTVEGFREAWEEEWSRSTSESWQERINKMSAKIQIWAKEHRSPQNRLSEAQAALYKNQTLHPFLQNPSLEEQCMAEINKAEEELEMYWRQRAKMQWACQGDRNTVFFHTAATNRRRRNMILRIKNEEGEWVSEESKVRRAFVSYFKELYSPNQTQDEENAANFFNEIGPEPWQKIPQTEQAPLMRIPNTGRDK